MNPLLRPRSLPELGREGVWLWAWLRSLRTGLDPGCPGAGSACFFNFDSQVIGFPVVEINFPGSSGAASTAVSTGSSPVPVSLQLSNEIGFKVSPLWDCGASQWGPSFGT